MKQIRLGLVGSANSHQKDWLECFHRHAEIKVVAISDRSRFRTYGGEEHARRLGVDCHCDSRDLLGRGDVDAVSICSETTLRAEQTVAACHVSKHVFLDTPFADTLQDGRAIVNAVQAAGVKFYMGFRPPPVLSFGACVNYCPMGFLVPIHHIDLIGE